MSKRYENKPLAVRISMAAKLLSVHRATIYRWEAAGLIRVNRIGNIPIISMEEIERLLASPIKQDEPAK
jgi:excisionase family DNA binding protein